MRVGRGMWWHGGAAGPGRLLWFVRMWNSPGESLASFLLVVMMTTPEGVLLPVGGVILEPILSAWAFLCENPIHLVDERRRHHWCRYLLGGIVGRDPSQPDDGRHVGGLAGWLGAGGELEGGCRACATVTKIILAAGGCHMDVGFGCL